MKVYVCIFLCGAIIQLASAGDEAKEMMAATVEACAKEIGSSKDDINAIINKEKDLSESAKCLLTCILKKFGLVGADGKASVDGAKNVIASMQPGNTDLMEKIGAIASKCSSAPGPGDSECEAAFKYFRCSKQEMMTQGLPTLM